MNSALPFSYNTCLESGDFDEVQTFLNSRIDEREVKPLTSQGGSINRFTLQPLQKTFVFGACWGERVHVRSGALSTCHLVLPLNRTIRVCNINRTLGTNEILIMMPGSEADLIWDAGTSAIVITFDSETVQAWSGLKSESLLSGALRILCSSSRQARSLFSLLQCVASQHQINEGNVQPVMQQHWENLLIETLSDQLTDTIPAQIDILPLHLRRAVDWLKAHIEHPLNVSDLVKIAGCSRRSLETGFQQFIGCSPARYILQQKLELAHQRLQQAQGSVSDVVYQCGFNHLSHFTRLYKDYYGETPSQTLRQRTLVTRG
ncbi:helix-turn-helix protein [Marinobacterium halophilum]|uniref:Helix-turn-helix protein n=1 Tax=Marinobacterium halophilum TaxID=267374 RepID=A0A2P8ETT6_9GAMM|nr:AraC family transcriptional regulator [Marinobacterium halophilum]PSL12873.1 helix-turn-helix protein [Marinobacterium halophilum]